MLLLAPSASEILKNLITQHLQETPVRPFELLNALGRQYSDSDVKEALLALLQEGDVELASDRKLRVHVAA